jgi:putative ABC transport system permease protein
MIAGLMADLRHAFRLYLKTPWQSLLAILALATAMALVSAMAGLWSDLHLRGTPGVENDRGLITLGRTGNMPFARLSAEAVSHLAATSQTLHSVSGAALFQWAADIELEERLLEGRIEPVLPGYFETVQPRLIAGRGLVETDYDGDGAAVMVISHALWQKHFDGDLAILGQEVRLGEAAWQVVGITDPAFRGMGAQTPLMWMPYRSHARQFQAGMPTEFVEGAPIYRPVLRAHDGVGPAAIAGEIKGLITDLPTSNLGRSFGRSIEAEELFVLRGLVASPQAYQAARRQVSLMLAAALLIAIVAAVNVGIFLLARAPGRRRELALRQALGAGRRRLAGQLIIEAAVLVVLATLVGVFGSLWLAAAFKELAFLSNAGFSGQALNLPALMFATALAALLTILVALVPIAVVRSKRLGQDSRQSSARPGLFQHAAGLLQLGLAGAVGAAALGFITHLWLMETRDLGMSAEDITLVEVSIEPRPGRRIQFDQEAVGPVRSEVRASLLEVPGIQGIGFMAPVPGQRSFAISRSSVDGVEIEARIINISPGTLDVLRIPLLHGRDFEDDSEAGVMVNSRYAEQVWGETDVVGRFIQRDEEGEPDERGRIIGVVGDVIFDHPDEAPGPMIFSPTQGFMGLMAGIVVRGQADPELLKSRIEPRLKAAMEELYVRDIKPLSEQLAELTRIDRARAGITALFGAVIVLLAGFGFFAMQRFLVDSGQRETAIRMALGAGPRLVRRHVLGRALRAGMPGLVFGSLFGLILVAWLSEDLISRSVSAPAIAAIIALGLAVLMLIASLQPARRAGRLTPGALLRQD